MARGFTPEQGRAFGGASPVAITAGKYGHGQSQVTIASSAKRFKTYTYNANGVRELAA